MKRLLMLPLVCAALLAAASPPSESRAQAGRSVKIGLVSSLTRGMPPAIVRLAMGPFKSLMETQTGLSGDVVEGGDALALGKKLAGDDVQIGVFHGYEFAWAKEKYPKLEPIAVCINKQRTVRIVLVTSASSKVTSAEDLAGKKLAYARTNRDNCRLYLEHACLGKGRTIDKHFDVTSADGAEEALEMVASGKAESAVVDGVAMEDFRSRKPGRAKKVRVLNQSDPFPPGIIAYAPGRLAEADVRAFRNGLIAAKGTTGGRAMLTMLKLTAFEAPPSDLDELLAKTAKAYPAK